MDHHNFNDTEEWPELVACNKSVELPYPVVEIDVSFGSDSPPIQPVLMETPDNEPFEWNPWIFPAASTLSRQDENLVSEMNERGFMRLVFERCEVFVKAACVSLPRSKALHGGGKVHHDTKRKMTLNAVSPYLSSLCSEQNKNNLKYDKDHTGKCIPWFAGIYTYCQYFIDPDVADGPYGQCLVLMKMTNSKRMRRWLYVTWRRQSIKAKSDEQVMPVQNILPVSHQINMQANTDICSIKDLRMEDSSKCKPKGMTPSMYDEIGRCLRKYVTKENEFNTGADGPYANAAKDLGKKNNRSQRLGLYVTWRENRGNVKVSMEELLNEMAPEDSNVPSENTPLPQRKGKRRNDIMYDKTSNKKPRIDGGKHSKIKENSNNVAKIEKTSELKQNKCVTDNGSDKDLVTEVSKKIQINNVNGQVSSGNDSTKITRHLADDDANNQCKLKSGNEIDQRMELTSTGVNKTYNDDEKMSSQAKGYCICGANKRNWSFKGPMIQCDVCRKWYHFKCINLELFSDPDDETHFECGMKDCKSSSLNIKFADMTNYPLVKKELQEAKSVPEKQVITKENFALQLGLTPVKLTDESVCMHEQEHCESFTQKSSSAEETIWKESSSDSITQIQSVGSTFNIEMGKQSNCEESISNESSPQNEASSDTNLLYDYNMVGLHEKNLNTDFHIPNRNEYERNSASSNRIKEAHKEFSIHHKKIIKYVKKLSDNKIGDLNNKERIYIEEMLIQELEFLDGLDCHNFQPLKQQRKNLIDLINSGLDQIEFFNKEGQIDFTPKIDENIDEIENKLNQVNKCVDDNFENARAFGTEDENKIMESNDKNDSVGLMDKKNKELSDTFKKYRMHHKECLKLIERVTCTSMDNKAKKYIEEMLVQKVDILNGLDCNALIELKNNRNQLICMINKTLDQLESQNQEKEQDAERSITLSMRKENNYNSDTSLNTKGTSSSQSITQKLEKIAFEDNIESGDESECDRETMFSKSTISSVLGYEIPNSEYFTKELDKKSSFHLDTNIYDQLYQQKKNRYFKRGTWESYYVKGLKVSNPFCVFRFEHHHISTAVKKDNRRIFFASAACTFSGCPVKAKLEMFDKTLVTVNYTGNIKHHVNEQHSRYIRAEERKELKEEFKGGIKPLTKYLEVVKKHTPEELVSGNIDGFGKNSRVYAQIACESRQEARRSDNILSSLLSQQHDMKKDCPTGFIQKICAKPLYVIYWSKGGLALYHERAASNALFWDATGSVCRRSDDGKQMLYYELAIRHPVKGKMGIPVTAMVSSDQSLPIISDWLKSFRHGEKKQFGYNKVVTPKLIISDQAMVFILAALQEFNGEDMNSFLSRAWDIINEKSPYDPSKTLVHLCASHFMNTCKKYIEKKVGKKNKAAYLYMIGLLMNCRSIHDAGEILLDIFVILQSPTLNNVNISNYDRLKRKINSYETSSEQFGINEPTGINDCSDTNTNTNLFTEEEYQAAGTSSKFREWANNVAQKAQLITDKMDCSQPTSNSWYSPDFYQYLKNKLMPIYPLWSLILMTIPGFNLDIVKTNSTVENRFRILKYIGLNSRSQYRIDEFSDALYTQTVAIQKLSCLESLKFRSNVKLTRKKTYEARQPGKKVRQETTEHWNKKKSQPINFKNKQGKYQKAPAIEIGVESPVIRRKSFPRKQTKEDVILDIKPTISSDCHVSAENNKKLETSQMAVENFHSNLCTMLNFGATCWFNSLLQSLSASNFSKRIISKVLANKSINVDVEPGCKEIAIKSIGDLLWHMATEGKGKRVPKELLSSTLQNVVNAIPGFTQTRQQDVHEFNTGLISDISDQLKEHIELISTSICSNCKNKHSHKIKDGQSLVFNVIPEVDNISVQTLADNLLREGIRTQKCSHCNREEPHDMKNTIIATPRTLLVVLSRYATSGNCIKKLHNNIDVNEQLTIETERGSVMYKLKSMVCHQGDSTNSGHYTAVVKTGTGFVCCDDLHLYNVGKDYTLNTAYVIVYDKEDDNIPAFVEPFIECFSNSTSLKKLIADRKMKHHNKSKTAFLTDLMKHGFSEDVKNDFLTCFLPFVETQLNMSIQDLTLELFFEAFIKHILYVGSPVGPLLSAEYLELCSKHIWKCCTCGLLDIENDNSLLLALDKFNSCAIEKNIRQIKGNRVLKQCQCNKNTRKTIITSIPTSIVIHVKNCKDLTNASLDRLDLKHLLIPHIENDSTNFKLDMILCRDGNTYFSAKNNSGEIYKTDMENFSRQPIALANLSEVTLFYNKSVETGFIDEYMNRLVKTDFKMNNTTMMPRVLKSQPGTNVQNTLINGVRINKRFLSTITNPKMWLTSDNINVYMHLLSQDSTKKVHIVDSSWFSHSLLKNNNPENIELLLTKTESKKSWFDFELIVIPVNECNRHWTLVVVSIKEKTVIFCDSYSSNSSANEISFQIMRYLQFESVMHTGQILNLNDWKFSLMNYMEKFPFQTDGSSCGVYVCAMARAIIYNTALPTENNLISFRRLMANEISLGYLQ